jgi:alpha-L-fucosidase
MIATRRSFLLAAPLALSSSRGDSRVDAPRPYGAVPSDRQLRWSELEFYNFLHFTVNTFTDREWGTGDEDPSIFNPSAFDADAIVETLKAAGSSGVILTCKHHDGFCLWPTKTTEHCIRNSSWRGGRGDIVKDISEAAARHGLKFGVYLSPWDRNQSTYGTPRYLEIYRAQARELLTNYGPVCEIWHDGANGGDGYYGGAREKRVIDKHAYYDWSNTWKLERELQPGAVIFSDAGPDVRWVGNETGVAGETCWATYTPQSAGGGPGVPGDIREAESSVGTRNGKYWMPAECDVSIRPGWFWHEAENSKVKTPRQIRELYYASVGRGGSLLLNVPPDRRGLIHEADAASLREFGSLRRETFRSNLAAQARVAASNVRGHRPEWGGRNLVDGDRHSYWSTDDGITNADVVFEFSRPVRFNLVRLREYIALGQRIDAFAVDLWRDGDWQIFGIGTSIGLGRILRSTDFVTTTRIRLRIIRATASPAISECGVFAEAT